MGASLAAFQEEGMWAVSSMSMKSCEMRTMSKPGEAHVGNVLRDKGGQLNIPTQIERVRTCAP
eukprot:1156612-Pelagomonas_calceolata.AAC.2